jgi:hypothetical protein
MTNKKNIVIKVKYPVSGRTAEDYAPAPQMITEWNVKRILLAAGIIVLILVSLVYFMSKDTQNTDLPNSSVPPEKIANTSEKQEIPQEITIKKPVVEAAGNSVKPETEVNPKKKPIVSIKVKEVKKKQPDHKLIKERRHSKVNNVRRALLTYEINNKEPVGEIAQTVNVSQTKPVPVYYYTELYKMNGRKVYHEWLQNGAIVSRQELIISADRWRTSSRRLLTDNAKGNWTVRLVDENGQLLNEKTFKVDLIK